MTLTKPVNLLWLEMLKAAPAEVDTAVKWFENERGFKDVKYYLSSGLTCLDEKHIQCFEKRHHGFIKHRLSIGRQLVIPIRSTYSDEVKNLFFRTITPCDKNEKTRLLPGAGGWSESDYSPRAFGFPHLLNDFPNFNYLRRHG